jgi:hypothetical protein
MLLIDAGRGNVKKLKLIFEKKNYHLVELIFALNSETKSN